MIMLCGAINSPAAASHAFTLHYTPEEYKTKNLPLRQRIRKGIIFGVFLLFPIIINYLSPYLIIAGASEGIINGSLIMFGLMFISSLVVGRAWCAWVCPGGGLGEIFFPVNNMSVNRRWADWVKWLIWFPWLAAIIFAATSAGGYKRVDFFYMTESGISVTDPQNYVIYLGVVGIFVILALTVGRRGACHTICWMAPFMILGRKLRNLLPWPALRLEAHASACTDCLTCTRGCPMSLDVNGMVKIEQMEHSECILCLSCVDNCPSGAIRQVFKAGK